jgi:bifunctional DNase/RNase
VVQMRVRYVRRHTPTGSDVAVLGPAASAVEHPMIALTVSRPEALELVDELEQRPTPRTGIYDLLVSVLGSAGTSVTSIEVREAPGQSAQARLELTGPRGRSEIQVEVGQAIGISVRIGKPLDVSERLIEAVTPPASRTPEAAAPVPETTPASQTVEVSERAQVDVPDRFRRAFDE